MSLVGWLQLNGNVTNKGLDNFTVSGTPAYNNNGKLASQSLSLGNRVTFTVPSLANAKTFSIAFWVLINTDSSKTTNWVDVLTMVSRNSADSAGSQFRWETCYGSSKDSVGLGAYEGGSSPFVGASNANTLTATKGVWMHVAAVADKANNIVRWYLDGVQKVTRTHGDGFLTGVGWIGENNAINGSIQDVRFYNHALSVKEVKELAKGLSIHYKLNGSGANPNLVYNSQVWNNSVAITDSNPLTRTLVNYDGYNIQRFTSTGSITKGGIYTSCFSGNRWNGGTYTWSIEIRGNRSFRIPTVGHERFTRIACDISTEWKKFTGTGVYGQSSYSAFVMYFNSTYPMTSGDWFEVRNFKVEEGSIATSWIPCHYDGNYASLGFGRKVLPYSIVGSPSNNTGYFGNNFTTANYLNTSYTVPWNSWGDWEIYCKFTTGTDITTNQIITNCVSGNALDFGLQGGIFKIGLSTGSSWDLADWAGCFTVEASKTYYVKIAFTGSAYTVSHSVTSFDSVTQDWSLSTSTKIANDGSNRLIGNNRAAGLPFLGYIDMEKFTIKTGGRTVYNGCTNYIYNPEPDCSGFGNNGTVAGRVFPAVGSRRGLSSTQFSGGNVNTNNGFPKGTMPPFTVNCWVNPQGGVNWYDYWCFRVTNYAGSTVDCRMEVSNNGANIGYYGTFPSVSTTTTKGQWYMMTLTHDGAGNLKAYKDSVQFASVTCTQESHLNWSPNGYFRVGDGAIDFKGTDYRVYATCLSADDIKSLYQTGASIVKNGALMTGQLVEE